MNDFVEKPAADKAPSNLVIASRYIFTPEIFDLLEKTKPGKNNEIQLTDAMRELVKKQDMYGLKFNGKRYDIGNKMSDYLVNFIMTGSPNGKGLSEWPAWMEGKVQYMELGDAFFFRSMAKEKAEFWITFYNNKFGLD